VDCFNRFNGRRSGNGNDVVILSHGFGTDQTAWTALRPWLEERYDVVSFDLAGCGPRGADVYDPERHGNWCCAARRAVTILFRSLGFARGFSEPSLRVALRYWY